MNYLRTRLFSLSVVFLAAFCGTLIGCSGGGGSSSGFFSGRATFPPQLQTGADLEPVKDSDFDVLDLNLPADAGVVASGRTDEDGNFEISIDRTTAIAIVVKGGVRVSGLFPGDDGDFAKNLDGTTDVACEAGVTAVYDGSIRDEDLTLERINNLEAGAAVVVATQDVDYTDPTSVSAAAVAVRTLTDDGAHLPS
jgi:hypothetical protein